MNLRSKRFDLVALDRPQQHGAIDNRTRRIEMGRLSNWNEANCFTGRADGAEFEC